MANAGRTDRSGRITLPKSGSWGTVSQDFLFLTASLYRLSRDEATSRPDRKTSRFVYVGIPLLLAAIQSFAIEYEGMLRAEPLPIELSADSLARLMETRYGVTGDLLENLRDLTEIRNEIIHPNPMPTGTPDNWPDYLRHIKQKGLLSSTGDPTADYIMLAQIASHRLFNWSVEVTNGLYRAIVNSNPTKAQLFQNLLDENFKTLFG